MYDDPYRRLLIRTLLALALGTALVVVCYYWVDRPVAFYVHDHQINHITAFRWLTYPPPLVQDWSPLVLALLLVRRAFGPLAHWQHVLLVALVAVLLAHTFRMALGDLCGRYWPVTWFDNNPSLIGTGTYGFHPFQYGDDTGSFPSGHASRTLAFAAVWWWAVPRSRLVCILVCPPLLISLVAMNYHFVGDVFAGCVLGTIIAAYATQMAGLAGGPNIPLCATED